MSVELVFYCVVFSHPLDGVKVVAIFKDWKKAIDYVSGRDDLRVREVKTLEEAL